jgi:chromosome segregation ATPase
MISLMLELLGLLLAAMVIGWWCGSRYFRWRASRISETFEAVRKVDSETKAQLTRDLASSREEVSLAATAQAAAEARAMELGSSLAGREAELDASKAEVEAAQNELKGLQRKFVIAEQAIKALQAQREESARTLGQLATEAEATREESQTRKLELEQLQQERAGIHNQAQENLRRLKELESDVLATLNRSAPFINEEAEINDSSHEQMG